MIPSDSSSTGEYLPYQIRKTSPLTFECLLPSQARAPPLSHQRLTRGVSGVRGFPTRELNRDDHHVRDVMSHRGRGFDPYIYSSSRFLSLKSIVRENVDQILLKQDFKTTCRLATFATIIAVETCSCGRITTVMKLQRILYRGTHSYRNLQLVAQSFPSCNVSPLLRPARSASSVCITGCPHVTIRYDSRTAGKSPWAMLRLHLHRMRRIAGKRAPSVEKFPVSY
jgi:hypothetical protein